MSLSYIDREGQEGDVFMNRNKNVLEVPKNLKGGNKLQWKPLHGTDLDGQLRKEEWTQSDPSPEVGGDVFMHKNGFN